MILVAPEETLFVEADLKKHREKFLPNRPRRARRIRQKPRELLGTLNL